MYDYYLIIGGMPEYVNSWANNRDLYEIQKIQHNLIQIYENDSKIAIRYSRRGFKIDGKIINIPLYLVNKTFDLIG